MLRESVPLWCVDNVQTNSSAHFVCFRDAQNVMQGARNIVMRDSTFYVAQNVCSVIPALMV